ncbi:hypothetical protein KBT16_00605 [Nostoc sp. CCCryo 231-06]|nr:hypothetical protein [Nostoc sp. CCCryo 231-06]
MQLRFSAWVRREDVKPEFNNNYKRSQTSCLVIGGAIALFDSAPAQIMVKFED